MFEVRCVAKNESMNPTKRALGAFVGGEGRNRHEVRFEVMGRLEENRSGFSIFTDESTAYEIGKAYRLTIE